MEIVTRRRDLLAAGFSSAEVRAFLRDGTLASVRRGTYLYGALPEDVEARHALQVRACLPYVSAAAVVSHVSAAVLHGIATWRVPLEKVHVTRARAGGARRGHGVHVHAATLDTADVVDVGGVPVTSPARTVVDLARSVPFEAAVVVADSALHRGLVTPSDLAAEMGRAARRRGMAAARRAIAFADGRAESVGESRSRVALERIGLPAPELQHVVRSSTGAEIGRVDFWWEQLQTIGEFDGRAKYGRLLRPGQEPGEVVWREKRREDALRGTGARVIRWTWWDLDHLDALAALFPADQRRQRVDLAALR